MQLFYIRAEDENGINLDLFVNAAGPAPAVVGWQSYYGEAATDCLTVLVYRLGQALPGAISWDDIPCLKYRQDMGQFMLIGTHNPGDALEGVER